MIPSCDLLLKKKTAIRTFRMWYCGSRDVAPRKSDISQNGPAFQSTLLNSKNTFIIGAIKQCRKRKVLLFLTIILGCFIGSGKNAMEIVPVRLDLVIEDPCWFHKLQDPVFVCTVDSMDLTISWRRDWVHIAVGGKPVGNDRFMYNMSAGTLENNTVRHEKLQLSDNITDDVLARGSKILCENQGYQSQRLKLHIPDCQSCGACFEGTTSIYVDKTPINNDSDMVPADGTLPGTTGTSRNVTKALGIRHPLVVVMLTVATIGVVCSVTAALLLVYKQRRRLYCHWPHEKGKGTYAGVDSDAQRSLTTGILNA